VYKPVDSVDNFVKTAVTVKSFVENGV